MWESSINSSWKLKRIFWCVFCRWCVHIIIHMLITWEKDTKMVLLMWKLFEFSIKKAWNEYRKKNEKITTHSISNRITCAYFTIHSHMMFSKLLCRHTQTETDRHKRIQTHTRTNTTIFTSVVGARSNIHNKWPIKALKTILCWYIQRHHRHLSVHKKCVCIFHVRRSTQRD